MGRFFCITFAALVCFDASATTSIHVVGSGLDSCGTWIKNRKTEPEWHQAGQWINGYYVAAQEILPEHISLKKVDSYALLSFVDKYCAENPLNDVHSAMLPLLEALVKKK